MHKRKDFKFKKGVIDGLKHLVKKKYYIFIVTNQAGIAKGIYKKNDFLNLQNTLKQELSKKNIYFDDVQYSPFHRKGIILKYKKTSNLRKPGNQMILNIFKKFLINKKKSFMIGDKNSDKECAKKSNLYFSFTNSNFLNLTKKIIKNI